MSTISQNKITFSSNEPQALSKEQQQLLQKISDSSNPELQALAKNQAANDFRNKPATKTTNAVGTMIPYADSFIRGAATPGNFSTKALTTLDTGKDWGIFILAAHLYNKFLNKVISKSPTLQKFTDNHPAITMIGTVASGVYVARKAVKYFNILTEHMLKLIRDPANPNQNVLVEHLDNKYGERLNNMRGAEFIQNKIFKPIENFVQRPAAKWLGVAVAVGLIGLLCKTVHNAHKMGKDSGKNYENLKDMRYQITRNQRDQLAAQLQNGKV